MRPCDDRDGSRRGRRCPRQVDSEQERQRQERIAARVLYAVNVLGLLLVIMVLLRLNGVF